jgi:hypothetical protein
VGGWVCGACGGCVRASLMPQPCCAMPPPLPPLQQYRVDMPDDMFMAKASNDVLMTLVMLWSACGYFTSPDLRTALLNPTWSDLALEQSILPCLDGDGHPGISASPLEELNALLKFCVQGEGLDPDKFSGHGGCRARWAGLDGCTAPGCMPWVQHAWWR